MGRVLDPILVGSIGILIIALAVIVIVPIDISPSRDILADSLFRDGAQSIPPERFRDPSPHAVWLPSDLFVWDSVRAGHLPLWDRMQGGGYSPVIAVQNGVFHPLRWIVAMFPRASAPSALIAIAIWCGFAGVYFLLRSAFGTSRLAALFGGVAFAFGPAAMSMALFSGMLLPLVHLPWAVAFLVRARSRRILSGSTPLIVTLALMLIAGHPLVFLVSLFALIAVSSGLSLSTRSLRSLAVMATAGIAALFLVAFAWLPTAMAFNDLWTYKASRSGWLFGYYAFGEWVKVIRNVTSDRLVISGARFIDEPASFGYVGVAVLLLIVAGIILRRRDALTRICAWILLLFFLFTLPGPWMAPLIAIPPIAYIKPWYYSGAFGLFAALVAALGVDSLWRATRRTAVIGVLLAVVAIAIYFARADRVLSPRRGHVVLDSPAWRFLRGDREPFRITALWGRTHLSNYSRITGIEDVRYNGPAMSLRYHLWWMLLDPFVLQHTYPTTRITDRLDDPLVADFNIKYILESRLAHYSSLYTNPDPRLRDTMLSRRLSDDRFPIVFRAPSIEIRLNRHYRPRAHFASRVTRADSPLAAIQMLERTTEKSGAVVEAEAPLPQGAIGAVTLTYPSDSQVLMDVRSQTGGLVVLHDTYADGWTAAVDGKAATVLPVNLLSRGMVVPPGRHHITMRYSPPGLVTGTGLSIATILVMVLASARLRSHADTRQTAGDH